jgi:carotenoid cleavage dioxygenase-like enzyme
MATTAPARTDHRLGFTTLDREVSLDRLPVSGELPAWLQGSLVRTGPAAFEAGGPPLRHWFDGLAMLHAFSFAGGEVSYANRWLHSDAWKEAQRGEMRRGEFGTDPCRSIFRRAMSLFSPGATDNGNVNVTRLGDRFLAMTETPMPIEFDPRTLETIGHAPVSDKGDGQVTTAHPHLDHRSGALLNYTARFSRTSTYRVYARRSDEARRRVLATIKARHPAYMHSFGMTERHVVLAEFPLVVDPLRLALSGRPFIENYRWEPERGTRIHLVPLDGGEPLGPFVADPFFCFHHINAYETQDGEVVVDLCTYEDASIIEALYLDPLRAARALPDNRPLRLTIQPDGGAVRSEQLGDTNLELPRINYRHHNGRPYRYAWGVKADGAWLDHVVKLDVETGEHATWSEDGLYPGEPVFVPAPDAKAEDDGVLLSVILDPARGTSSLLVLDADTLAERARAEVPHHIPHGFHGQYFGGL